MLHLFLRYFFKKRIYSFTEITNIDDVTHCLQCNKSLRTLSFNSVRRTPTMGDAAIVEMLRALESNRSLYSFAINGDASSEPITTAISSINLKNSKRFLI